MVTRCPKCATAFRITSAQLQSAKGSVRCGSCLHVFKAQDHLVKNPAPAKPETTTAHKPAATANTTATATPTPKSNTPAPTPVISQKPAAAKPVAGTAPKTTPAQAVLKPTKPQAATQKPAAPKTVAPVIKKSSLDDIDDILISDDMDEKRKSKEENPYEHDDFLELNIKPQLSVSLFDRNVREYKEY
jgi:predicted Zn finger-like uncharacterized protein